jgi:Domain of Unknown Function (DUF928)
MRKALILFVLPLTVSLGLISRNATAQSSGGTVFRPTGSPRSTTGAASRGVCAIATANNQPSTTRVIPLIPATDGELTTSAHPTILVQNPDPTPQQAELSLWDENNNGIYQTTLSLPGKAGIVSIKLPDSSPELVVGKRYKWSLALICDPRQRDRDVVVEGWMQRTELSSTTMQQLSGVSDLDRVRIYAENRIWYDTLATMAELVKMHPNDSTILGRWETLLQSVGLKEVAQAPLVN